MFCMPFADVSAGAEVQRDPSAAASGSKVAASQCGCMAASSTAAPAQTAAVEPPSIEEVLATHAEPGADVQLKFEGDALVPSHALLLRMWSGVLRGALEAEGGSDAGMRKAGSSCGGKAAGEQAAAPAQVIPMPGTSQAEWLKIVPFLYPVVPLPEVNWDNLEALLVLGNKYDMPCMLAHADKFIRANTGSLDNACTSPYFVWKWLQLTDAAGLDEACRQCADKAVTLCRALGVEQERIEGLSAKALQHLVVRLAPPPSGPPHCPRCGCSRTFKCSYCGHNIS